MGFLFWRKKANEERAEKLDDVLWFAPATTSAGTYVTAETAMRLSAVYACVRLLSETVASLPLFVYKRLPGGGKEKASELDLFRLLHNEPNDFQTSASFRETLQAHLLLRGNAYARLIYGRGARQGRIEKLIPLHPDNVNPILLDSGQKVFDVYDKNGQTKTYKAHEILHIPALSYDGVRGLDPISQQAESFGLAIAANQYASGFFANSATPSGILEYPGKLSETAYSRLKEGWKKSNAAANKASQGVAVLEEGAKWHQLAMTNEQAQFLETRKMSRSEIASIFHVPPHMIGDLERATFSNIEQQSLEFVIFTVRPWLVRWEQELNRILFSTAEKETYFCEFLVDGLLRGDIKSRYEAYAIARQQGFLNVDEIREMENRNPLPDGEGQIYLTPLNMVDAATGKEAPQQQDDNAIKEDDNAAKRMRAASSGLLSSILGRVFRKIDRAEATAAKKGERFSEEKREEWRKFAADCLRAAAISTVESVRFVEGAAGGAIVSQSDVETAVDVVLASFITQVSNSDEQREARLEALTDELLDALWLCATTRTLHQGAATVAPVVNVTQAPIVVDVHIPAPEKDALRSEITWDVDANGKRKAIIKRLDA